MGVAACACGALLAGCTSAEGGDGGGGGSPRPDPSRSRAAAPSPKGDGTRQTPTPESVRADPGKLPRQPTAARELIAEVLAGPEVFGRSAARGTPYERPADNWPVLGEDCVWRRGEVPDDILATRTRFYELPASGDKGPVRLTATVTVHRTAQGAEWENAEMLEESMRCPEQQLRGGERVTGLLSTAAYFGESGNGVAEDMLSESGEYVSAALGGPYPYAWKQARTGSVLVSVSVKGAEGRAKADLVNLLADPLATMVTRLQGRIGKSGPSGESEPSGKSASAGKPGPAGEPASYGERAYGERAYGEPASAGERGPAGGSRSWTR